MSVGNVNNIGQTYNASYPKYLEKRRNNGAFLALSGGTLGTSAVALKLVNNSFALKNPKLLLGAAIVAFAASIFGISEMGSSTKELKKYQTEQNNQMMDTFVKTQQNKEKKQGLSDIEAINLISGLSNPITAGITTVDFANKIKTT